MTKLKDTVGIVTDKLGVMACTNCGVEIDISEYSIFEAFHCPECEKGQTVPGKLGNFLLLDELGAGGMGAVYLAQDTSLQRRVALKVMRRQYGQNPKLYESFVREAQATAQLNHPNVVQIYSFGLEKGQPYIVMELVDGGRLDLMMENNRRVEELDLLETAAEVVSGLTAADEAGLTHGDLKPANILYDKNGAAKVVDFGLARFVGAQQENQSEIWGTPYYIAPEKAKSRKEDARSDQYSLGATLWHALAGYPPFDGPTATDVVVARLKEPAPRLDELFDDISTTTADIVVRMLDRKPTMRYPNYLSLHKDLDDAIAEVTAAKEAGVPPARRKKGPQSAMIAAPKQSAKNSGIGMQIMALSMVVLLSLVSGWYFFIHRAKPPKPAPPPVVNPGGTPKKARQDLNPFLSLERKWLNESIQAYQDGDSFTHDARLHKIRKYLKDEQASMQWLRFSQGMTMMLTGLEKQVAASADKVIKAQIKWDGAPKKENPQLLAKLMNASIDYNAFKSQSAGAQPWFTELGGFVAATRCAWDGKPAEVEALIKPYASNAAKKPEWAYTWQPLAIKLRKDAAEMATIMPPGKKKPDVKKLKSFMENAHKIWFRMAEPHLPKILTAQERHKLAEKQKREAEARRKREALEKKNREAKKKQEELKKVRDLAGAIKDDLSSKNFEAAKLTYAQLEAELTTEEAKKELQPVKTRVDLQLAMKDWLIATLKKQRYAGARLQVKGIPTAANAEKIRFKFGSSYKDLTWAQLPLLDFAKIVSFYLESGDDLDEDKGRFAMGMAVYSYDQEKPSVAQKFVEKAVGFNRTLTQTSKELMPNL